LKDEENLSIHLEIMVEKEFSWKEKKTERKKIREKEKRKKERKKENKRKRKKKKGTKERKIQGWFDLPRSESKSPKSFQEIFPIIVLESTCDMIFPNIENNNG
jgi:hypothetical protein